MGESGYIPNSILAQVCGLNPRTWLCVGAGFAREDVKAQVLRQGRGFVGDAVLGLQELCARILGVQNAQILGPLARQEVLRVLLAEPRIQEVLKELKILRRQKDFFRRLDSALQSGRLTFAHPEEEEVYTERLAQLLGENALRLEVATLAKAYEAWIQASGWYDLPLLLRRATEAVLAGSVTLRLPQEILILSVQNPESLENHFWEILGERVIVRRISQWSQIMPFRSAPTQQKQWQMWHTIDDAADALADALLKDALTDALCKDTLTDVPQNVQQDSKTPSWEQDAILIPDVPAIRRSLKRALDRRGLPMAEPRDPTELLWNENVKWALSPLEVVARNFSRTTVLAWMRGHASSAECSAWVKAMQDLGIRSGLQNYQGEGLVDLHVRLSQLQLALRGSKQTCEDMAEAHLRVLRDSSHRRNTWILQWIEELWGALTEDWLRVGKKDQKAPPYFWLEKLQARIRESGPPVDGMKPGTGIRIYRLQQAPVVMARRVWILGLPAQWLAAEGSGSYWYTPWEREILSSEFAVRAASQISHERSTVLQSWIAGAEQTVFLDAHYENDGRERESITPLFFELKLDLDPLEMGAHASRQASYQGMLAAQPQEIHLSRVEGPRPTLSATLVDHSSRCSFLGLTYHRWKLRDLQEPGPDLWPQVKGNLLHAAVKQLEESYLQYGFFKLKPHEAVQKVWGKNPRGLIQSPRIVRHLQRRLCALLEAYCEREKEYLERSGARPKFLDSQRVQLEYPECFIVGQPDRVDEVDGGLFVMDLKASGLMPHGSVMIERGYRLQLPFYAVALQKTMQRPVLGVQFIELDRSGSRKSGIFFKAYNGKEPGKLTQARSNSKSLVDLDPADTWDSLEDQIRSTVKVYLQGEFAAFPNTDPRQKECQRCGVQDLCGYRRLGQGESELLTLEGE